MSATATTMTDAPTARPIPWVGTVAIPDGGRRSGGCTRARRRGPGSPRVQDHRRRRRRRGRSDGDDHHHGRGIPHGPGICRGPVHGVLERGSSFHGAQPIPSGIGCEARDLSIPGRARAARADRRARGTLSAAEVAEPADAADLNSAAAARACEFEFTSAPPVASRGGQLDVGSCRAAGRAGPNRPRLLPWSIDYRPLDALPVDVAAIVPDAAIRRTRRRSGHRRADRHPAIGSAADRRRADGSPLRRAGPDPAGPSAGERLAIGSRRPGPRRSLPARGRSPRRRAHRSGGRGAIALARSSARRSSSCSWPSSAMSRSRPPARLGEPANPSASAADASPPSRRRTASERWPR